MHESILGCQSFKFVLSSHKGVSCFCGKISSHLLSETGIGVQSSANGGTSLSDLMNVNQGLFDAFGGILELAHVGRKLLTESQRSCILGVSATDLHDIIKLLSLGFQSISESLKFGEQSFVDFEDCCNVHNRWESVVGGLGTINVIVRVHHFGPQFSSQNLNGSVRNNLV